MIAVARKLRIPLHRLWKTQPAFVPFPGVQPVPKPPEGLMRLDKNRSAVTATIEQEREV